jgi:hypothetical protein
MTEKNYPHGKAAALLSYALDTETVEFVGGEPLKQLVDDVCEDETERARLISLLSTSQSIHLPNVVLELLGTRLDRLKNELETAEDMDTVYGVWAQRVAGGTLLASVGFVTTGVITGGWGVLALGAGLVSGVATSYGRDRLKRRARLSRRNVEQTERLIGTIRDTMQNRG